ncbi:MAG: hypothetical protein H0X27_00720 [Caulobacteraceae bacterium]|nr:hypothetical protein [Caulobacteraceae bacterium]
MEVAATLPLGHRRVGLDRRANLRDDNIEGRRAAFIRDLDDELARAPKCHTLLLMSEDLFTCTKNAVQTYREFFARYASRLESLMYLRRQDRWLASLTLQGRKSGARQGLELIPATPKHYGSNIRIWNAESDACHIRRFEQEFLLNGDLIDDFCATAGADRADLATVAVHANPAIMQEQLDLIDVLNRKLERMPFYRRIRYRRTFIPFCADILGGTKIEFERGAAVEAFESYKGINGWLRATRDAAGPPLFFNADFSDYPEVARNDRRYTLDQLVHLQSVVAGRLRELGLTAPPVADQGSRDNVMNYIASAFIPLRKVEFESARALLKSRKADERKLAEDLGLSTTEDVSDFYDEDDG